MPRDRRLTLRREQFGRLKEVSNVQWDLGLQGLAVLGVMALVLGAFTHFVFWGRATRWLWLIASVAFFVLGLIISEVWFGWATEADLQPNIDGLSLDEVLIGLLVGALAVLVTRYLVGRRRHHPVTP
jgi:Na+/proline symporter